MDEIIQDDINEIIEKLISILGIISKIFEYFIKKQGGSSMDFCCCCIQMIMLDVQ